MKWYKKQMDQLKKAAKLTSSQSSGAEYSHEIKKNKVKKVNFSNPVAVGKLARPKTDARPQGK